jgi:hypothetical protein
LTIIALLLGAATLYAQDSARGRLNQFVVELANIDLTAEDSPAGIGGPIAEAGWLFIALRGEGEVSVTLTSGGEETVVLDAPGETMRHVQAGHMAVAVERGEGANLQRLIVRRVPEIMMYMYEGENAPDPQRWMTHSWEFLEEAILHSTNLIVSHDDEAYAPFARRWQERGGHWLANHSMRPFRDPEMDPAAYWKDALGGAVWNGTIHDEVLSIDQEHFQRYADGLARFRAMPESADRTVYLFCGGTAAIGDPTLLDFFAPTEETSAEGDRSVRCS